MEDNSKQAQVIYHLDITVAELSSEVKNMKKEIFNRIDSMNNDVRDVTIDLGILKRTGHIIAPKKDFEPANKHQRMKDSSLGGVVAGSIVTVITLLVEFFKVKS